MTPDTPPPTRGDRLTPDEVKSLLAEQFTPPRLWDEQPPPLKATQEWAVSGEHLPLADLSRHGSRAWAYVAIPLRAIALYADWIFQRGSRTVAALLLFLVIDQVIPIVPALSFT
ncbi:hypothetical protein AB0F91_39895 [Amycolatopsis sp. NPDC023774]|uniref:hypothetical protein n=1 Tax=Amycolatopsis sp. NPDC023774 TaxID=3155015 RepID=UPI0033CA7858